MLRKLRLARNRTETCMQQMDGTLSPVDRSATSRIDAGSTVCRFPIKNITEQD